MSHPPRSEIFDDVYFSAEDGLAETRHVFLKGNNLPQAWVDKDQFVIAETGFGTGLNFVAAWALFMQTSAPGQKLHFVSFEKYPLDRQVVYDSLIQALSSEDKYAPYIQSLIEHYPICTPGYHRIVLDSRVTLTLILDDVNQAMRVLDSPVDCWFLDGFKPSSNPEMWTDTVFQNMARLSRSGSTFSTFTAAGFVRRGLQNTGFTVHKVPGFGRKREMLTGVMP